MPYIFSREDFSSVVEAGEYEAIIEKIERNTTSSGRERIFIQLRIRNDVDQKYQGKCLFDNIWEDNNEPGMFDHDKLGRIVLTQPDNGKDGYFETIDDVISFLEGAYVRVKVEVQINDYVGTEVNVVKRWYKTRQAPQALANSSEQLAHSMTGVPAQTTVSANKNIVDDDLPF